MRHLHVLTCSAPSPPPHPLRSFRKKSQVTKSQLAKGQSGDAAHKDVEPTLPPIISPRPAPSEPAVLPAGHAGMHAAPAEPKAASPVDALEDTERKASISFDVGALVSVDL